MQEVKTQDYLHLKSYHASTATHALSAPSSYKSLALLALDTDYTVPQHTIIFQELRRVIVGGSRVLPTWSSDPALVVAVLLFINGASEALVGTHRSVGIVHPVT